MLLGILSFMQSYIASLVFNINFFKETAQSKKSPLSLSFSLNDLYSQGLALLSIGIVYIIISLSLHATSLSMPQGAVFFLTALVACLIGYLLRVPYAFLVAVTLFMKSGMLFMRGGMIGKVTFLEILFGLLFAMVIFCVGIVCEKKEWNRTSLLFQVFGAVVLFFHSFQLRLLGTVYDIEVSKKLPFSNNLYAQLALIVLTVGVLGYLLYQLQRRYKKEFSYLIPYISIIVSFIIFSLLPQSLAFQSQELMPAGIAWIFLFNGLFLWVIYADLLARKFSFINQIFFGGFLVNLFVEINYNFQAWAGVIIFITGLLLYNLFLAFQVKKLEFLRLVCLAFSLLVIGGGLCFFSSYFGINYLHEFMSKDTVEQLLIIIAPLLGCLAVSGVFAYKNGIGKKEDLYTYGLSGASLLVLFGSRLYPILTSEGLLTLWGAGCLALFSALYCFFITVVADSFQKYFSDVAFYPFLAVGFLFYSYVSWFFLKSNSFKLMSSQPVPFTKIILSGLFIYALFLLSKLFLDKKKYFLSQMYFEKAASFYLFLYSFRFMGKRIRYFFIMTDGFLHELLPLVGVGTLIAGLLYYCFVKGIKLNLVTHKTCNLITPFVGMVFAFNISCYLYSHMYGANLFMSSDPQMLEVFLINIFFLAAAHILLSLVDDTQNKTFFLLFGFACFVASPFAWAFHPLSQNEIFTRNSKFIPMTWFAIAMIYLLSVSFRALKDKKYEKGLQVVCGVAVIGELYFLSTFWGLQFFAENVRNSLTNLPLTTLAYFLPFFTLAIYLTTRAVLANTIQKKELIGLGVFTVGALLVFLPKAQILFIDGSLTSLGFVWAVIFNILVILSLLSCILIGYKHKSTLLINIGTGLMFLLIIAKYFDFFFTSLNKTVFFIVSGIVLIIVGYIMEKGRSYLLESFTKKTIRKRK